VWGSRWVSLSTEPVKFVMMTRLSWIDLLDRPSVCLPVYHWSKCKLCHSRAQAAMRFPVLISLYFLFGGKRPPQTKPNMYLTRSYTSSMMAMVDMMDLIRPDHVQSHLGKFCDVSHAIATWHRGFGSASGLESGRTQH
jgi:hypothetical protein